MSVFALCGRSLWGLRLLRRGKYRVVQKQVTRTGFNGVLRGNKNLRGL